jgi:hypothetical protein
MPPDRPPLRFRLWKAGVTVYADQTVAEDELRVSRGSAIRSRVELLLWRSSAGADGAPIVEEQH